MIDWQQIKHRMSDTQAALDRPLVIDTSRVESILRQRAAQLAARGQKHEQRGRRQDHLVFSLRSQRYAIAITALGEVFALGKCSPVPGADKAVRGVVNHRGEVRSIIDLAYLLNHEVADHDTADESTAQVMLVHHRGGAIGLAVDRLERIERIDLNALLEPSDLQDESSARRVLGVTVDGVIVLDIGPLLSHPLFQGQVTQRELELSC